MIRRGGVGQDIISAIEHNKYMGDYYNDSIFWVEVERIKPNPYQPRREFDEHKLADLADSIRQYGVLQPLTVTRKEIEREDGGLQVEYELIAGERRLRASKIANLVQVPVIIRARQDTDQERLELAIIENLQREDLNAIDRARAFQQLVDEFKLKHVEVGKKVGRSREYVSNTLRLLTLPDDIQQLISGGRLSEGHTRPILRLNDRPEEQQVLVKEIMLKRLTVREAESIAQRITYEKSRKKTMINPAIIEIEKELTENLGTRVQIEPKEVGGKVVISYFSADDLQQLMELMKSERALPEHIRATETLYESPDAAPIDSRKPHSTPLPSEQLPQTETREPLSRSVADPALGESSFAPAPVVAEVAVVTEEPLDQNDVPVSEKDYHDNRDEEDADLYSIRNFSL